jgi:ligand-binding sensor domain-containing protein
MNDFKQPMVEIMKTTQTTNGGTWINYTPPDWSKQFQQTGEYPTVSSILEAPDGTLWFGTHGGENSGGVGAYHFDGKTWTHFRKENGLPYDEINSMAVSPDGVIWFGGYNGMARYDGKNWTAYTTDNGLASNDIRSMAYSPDGTLWIGSIDKGLSRFDGKGWQYFLQQYNNNSIGNISILPDGSLLFSYGNDSSTELIRFDGQNWVDYPLPWTLHGVYTVNIASAPNGDLWFAMEFMGVYHLSKNNWTQYTVKDGLPSDDIHSVAVARDGSVWVGTVNGLSRFDGETWTIIPLQGDADNKWIGTILAASDGSVWISYYGGIAHFNPPATK